MSERRVEEINPGGRRRPKQAKRTKDYSDKNPLGLGFQAPCKHGSKSKFKCASFTLGSIIKNRKLFYRNTRKLHQDIYLARLMAPYEPQNKKKTNVNIKNRNVSCSYNLYTRKKTAKVVCKKFFMSVFSVGEKRLNRINRTTIAGNIPEEKRGGDRYGNKNKDKKDSLRNFLNNLPARESHYNRSKSKRIYLSSELTAKKLLNIYNDTHPQLNVKKTMFYKIFHREYNIGFSSPASDICSACILLLNKIKIEKNLEKKQELITLKRVHKLRAKAFNDLMKITLEEELSYCFDLQQVQPLPRTPIQDAFYARQVALYNFCVVCLTSRMPTFYTWDQTKAARGATEIGSALYDFLTQLTIPENIRTIRFFCDGCGGQNKNKHVIHILMYWLKNKSPAHVHQISLIFPVRGHSFLPADRVFGRIEKDLRKRPIITTIQEYHDIFEKHGQVKLLERDWNLINIKSLENNLNKLDGIQKMKRIYIRKVQRRNRTTGCTVTGFENFRFNGNETPETLLKRGKRIPCTIEELPPAFHPLKENMKKDVRSLLIKQFGENWEDLEELAWYKLLMQGVPDQNNLEEVDERNNEIQADSEEACLCNEEDIGDIRV